MWHDGGNGWSYRELARLPDDDAMVFWVTNQAHSETPDWDFEELGPEITEGGVERLLEGA